MSNSVRPCRRQPTRHPRPWHSPGKNSGVGCHFLLQCMKVKSEGEIAQSCLTLCDLMDRSLPGSSVLGIFQARVLEWGAITFSICFNGCLFCSGCARLGLFPLWNVLPLSLQQFPHDTSSAPATVYCMHACQVASVMFHSATP